MWRAWFDGMNVERVGESVSRAGEEGSNPVGDNVRELCDARFLLRFLVALRGLYGSGSMPRIGLGGSLISVLEPPQRQAAGLL